MSELVSSEGWLWPNDWLLKYNWLAAIPIPNISHDEDKIMLRNENGDVKVFSVAAIWNCIRPHNDEVGWYHLVWFQQQIPRHAIHAWLVIQRKLKNQDLLKQWDVQASRISLLCPFCESVPDSYDHLFFECGLPSNVWRHMTTFMGIPNMPMELSAIIDFISPYAKLKSIRSVVSKLVFAASCYNIWNERNCRLFKKEKRSQEQIIELIKSNARMKLMTCLFMKSHYSKELADIWVLPKSCIKDQ